MRQDRYRIGIRWQCETVETDFERHYVRSQQYHEGLTRSSRTRGSATDSQTKKDDLTLLHSIALDMESRG
jgi:hypothetical protein